MIFILKQNVLHVQKPLYVYCGADDESDIRFVCITSTNKQCELVCLHVFVDAAGASTGDADIVHCNPSKYLLFFFILIIKYLTYATKINNNEGVLDLECVAYCVDKY